MLQVGKDGKLAKYIFSSKKHKNESCAVFISDHDPALFRAGKIAPGNFRAGPGNHSPDSEGLPIRSRNFF